MGLAATQARFLAITSRKASCEFRSMQLAQQKLSLSREMQKATEDYQDALNATMLIWDADGTGDYRYNVSYDLMMNPSDLNKYTPYMLSRPDGKIAIDDKMKQALAAAGFNMVTDPTTGEISSDGGIWYNGALVYRGDDNFEAASGAAFITFIETLESNKGMSGAVANKIRDIESDGIYYKYLPGAGLGDELMGREEANQMYISSVLSYIDYIVENVANGYYSAGSKEEQLASMLIFDFDNDKSSSGGADLSCHLNTAWNSGYGATELLLNGKYLNNVTYNNDKTNKMKTADGTNMVGVSEYSTKAFTLADLLNEDVTLLVTGIQSYNIILGMMTNMLKTTSSFDSSQLINKEVNEWFDNIAGENAYEMLVAQAKSGINPSARSSLAILNYFDKLAKSMYTLFMPENADSVAENAFYTALQDTISSFRNNIWSGDVKSWVDSGAGDSCSEMYGKTAVQIADNYNCWVKTGNQWAISLSNLTEAFLTNFMNGMDSYQDGCLIAQKATASTYITDDPSYLYTVNVVDQDTKSGMWESEFYSIIFNNCCSSGWYVNEQVADDKYLSNALKNGQLFIVSKGNDNYFYQSRYAQAAGDCIRQESDEAAIAAAEREYIYKKNKINYKEELIEVESKNVDAELSALTTEYEAVKNMITKNIDKTFKMFQS